MRRYLKLLIWIFLFAIAVSHLSGCNAPSTNADIEKAQEVRSEDAREKPIIFTTNYPLTYFAERITDGTATINYLVPPNINPSLWQPKPTDVAKMQTGDLIFINGATYEKWLDFVSLPESKLIDTSVIFQEQYLEIENSQTHRHGPEGEHTHTGTVAITWLNLQFAIAQADNIRAALTHLRPDLAATFQENFLSLKQDLEDLDQELETALEPYINQPLLAPHPMYEYLAQRYNLNLKSVSWERNRVPNEVEWQQLQALLDTYPARLMIWDIPPDSASVAKLQKLNIESVVISTASNRPQQGDFLEIMRTNIAHFDAVNIN